MRKVCVVTTTRAEYGIMSRLIDRIEADKDLELCLIVSGTHLSKKFGNTISEIKTNITKKIDVEIETDMPNSMAVVIKKFSSTFKKLKPDIVMILGDRYEIMAVAISAMLNNIPIAHLHGGEATYGVIDEAIRHSITKMSHLHFVSCEEYKKRVIQLGENPKSVFNVGSLGTENIKEMSFLSKKDIEEYLGFKFNKKNLLVTYHPVTLENNTTKKQFAQLLKAIGKLDNTNVIFTSPNSDGNNGSILKQIEEYTNKNKNTIYIKSLGMMKYFSCLQFVDALVGNSSSGIVEVPSFKIATINIGDRQMGRIQAKSIVNCSPTSSEIYNAINKIYTDEFTTSLKTVKNHYYKKYTSENIIKTLKNYRLNNILKKEFYNLDFSI